MDLTYLITGDTTVDIANVRTANWKCQSKPVMLRSLLISNFGIFDYDFPDLS